MSKCRPTPDPKLIGIIKKGVMLEETYSRIKNGEIISQEEATRYVVIKIPYDLLKNDSETQITFKDIIHISTKE